MCLCFSLQAGLGWQSLVFVYSSGGGGSEEKKHILLTGSEAVSRSVIESIRKAANTASNYTHSIALTKNNEEKVEAIESELIKLGSEVRSRLVWSNGGVNIAMNARIYLSAWYIHTCSLELTSSGFLSSSRVTVYLYIHMCKQKSFCLV